MKVQDAASKYSWLLIPISVPFMWLLFPFRRRFNTYDHTVFVTYSLSFMMMLVVAGGAARRGRHVERSPSLLFFVPPFHMYRHLKQSYELGRFSAIMRTMALVTFAFIAAACSRLRRSPSARCRLAAAGIFLLKDADHRVLEAHLRPFGRQEWPRGRSMNSKLPSSARACRRAIEDRPARPLGGDTVVADRFADRGRLRLQPP